MTAGVKKTNPRFQSLLNDFVASLKKFKDVLKRAQAERLDPMFESRLIGQLTELVGSLSAASEAGEIGDALNINLLTLIDIIESIGEVSRKHVADTAESAEFKKKILRGLREIAEQTDSLFSGLGALEDPGMEATSGIIQKLNSAIEERIHYLTRIR